MGKLTKQDLLDHLNKYKDAVVIFGPKAMSYTIDQEMFSYLTPKSLKRENARFWADYNSGILQRDVETVPAQLALETLEEDIKHVFTQTMDSSLLATKLRDKTTHLHGQDWLYKCVKCKTLFPQPYMDTLNAEHLTPVCECCGGILRPNIILPKENYNDDVFHSLKEALLYTHTVLLVGFDFDEDAILNLVLDYAEMKKIRNQKEEEQRWLVSVGTDDMINIEDIAEFEFIVPGDINESMQRLVQK